MAAIRKRRDKWQVQIRRVGLRPISKSFHIRADAVAWARQMEVQADRGDLPPDPKALQRITLRELVERYRDTVSPRKRTAHVERIVLNAFLARSICSRRLSDLRTEDFAAYRDERLQAIKPTSLKRELVPIHHLFEVARNEWGLPIRENPLDKLQLKAPDQRRERRLKPGELDKLIDAARKCRNPLIAPIILFAVETGMRRGEILSMQRKNFDADSQSLLIPETKTGRSRTIPLTAVAVSLLQDRLSGNGNENERAFPISANCLRLAWERVKQRAGINDLHFHDLRHAAISRFFELGLSTPEVALISGHRDMRMLFRYSHAARETILEKFSRHTT